MTDVRALYLMSVLVLAAGFVAVVRPLEAAIDQQIDRRAQLELALSNDAHTLAGRPLLERERASIERRLTSLALFADRPQTMARFVHEIVRVAGARDVAIVAIESGMPSVESTAPGAIPFELTVSGPFERIIATMRDIVNAPVVAQIEIVSIEREKMRASSGHPVSAKFHIVLHYRSDARSEHTEKGRLRVIDQPAHA